MMSTLTFNVAETGGPRIVTGNGVSFWLGPHDAIAQDRYRDPYILRREPIPRTWGEWLKGVPRRYRETEIELPLSRRAMTIDEQLGGYSGRGMKRERA